ncbi:MAG: MerR family transcriptional regulator [Bacillota bacterium]
MAYKIKEVADMVGISVRTLHHYDRVGLLKPASITTAGYRLYTDLDLEKLQQILFFKELDFNLQQIKNILDNPGFDRREALISQKKLLIEKKKRLDAIIESVEKTLESIKGGTEMTKKDMFASFDMTEIEKHQKKYEEEVKQKYGNTEAYKESQKKTSGYTKDDWAAIMAKSDDIHQRLVALMDKGHDDPEVQQVIGEWKQHITDNFYTCTLEIFRGLGDLYVNDARYTANIDKYCQGLALFMMKAMHFYCDQQNIIS